MMAFIKKTWKDRPDTSTPLDANGLNNLESRIGNDIDNITTQLAQKANKEETRENTDVRPINVNEMDTETKQLFTGGAVAVVGEDAVGNENLKVQAVQPKNTTFFEGNYNIYEGGYINQGIDGTSSSLFLYKEVIEGNITATQKIKKNTVYTLRVVDSTDSDFFRVGLSAKFPSVEDYDVNGRFNMGQSVKSTAVFNDREVTFNSGDYEFLFVAVSSQGIVPRIILNEGDNTRPYIPLQIKEEFVKKQEFNNAYRKTRNVFNGEYTRLRLLYDTRSVFISDENPYLQVAIVPIKQQTEYTIKVHDVDSSDLFIVGTNPNNSPRGSYLSTGRKYLNGNIVRAIDENKVREVSFFNEYDEYAFVAVKSGVVNIDIRLQVEEGSVATEYIPHLEFNDGAEGNLGVRKIPLSEELGASKFLRNYEVLDIFKEDSAIVTHGSVILDTNTDEDKNKNAENSLGITMDSSAVDTSRIEFNFQEPVNFYRKDVGLHFYLPKESILDGINNITSKLRNLAVYLTTEDGRYFAYHPENGSNMFEGWNLRTFNHFSGIFLDGDNSADGRKSLEKIKTLRLHIEHPVEVTENVTLFVDSLEVYDSATRPAIRLEFDDAYKAIYNNAYPEMRKRGMRGCMHVITSRITDDYHELFATEKDLHTMHDNGWDICSHTHNHPRLSGETEESQLNELKLSQEILLEKGFRNGPQFFVSPYGDNTPYAINVAKKYYQTYRNTGYRRSGGLIVGDAYAMECVNAGSRGLENVKVLVDSVAEHNGFMSLMWHGEIGETWGGVRWETAEFAELLDHIQSKGIDIITLSDQFPGTQIR